MTQGVALGWIVCHPFRVKSALPGSPERRARWLTMSSRSRPRMMASQSAWGQARTRRQSTCPAGLEPGEHRQAGIGRLAFEAMANEWNGRVSAELRVVDIEVGK